MHDLVSARCAGHAARYRSAWKVFDRVFVLCSVVSHQTRTKLIAAWTLRAAITSACGVFTDCTAVLRRSISTTAPHVHWSVARARDANALTRPPFPVSQAQLCPL